MSGSNLFIGNYGGILISKIPFLYNAESGKNNWWRYLLTILLTIVPSFIVVLVILFVVLFFWAIMLVQSGSMDIMGQLNGILYNPLVLLLITIVLYVFFFMSFYLGMRFIHRRKLISLINTESKINWIKMMKGAGLWIAILGVFTLISLLFSPGYYKFTFNPDTFGILLIITLIGIPIQASFEELFFRGYLMQGIGLLSKKPIIPLLITSILFAILHAGNGVNMLINIFIVLQVLIIGIMFGIIALGENRIETAMGVHISNNLYAFLIVSSSDEVITGLPSIFTTQPSTLSDLTIGLLATILAAVILLSILFWNKKDKVFNIFRWEDTEPD